MKKLFIILIICLLIFTNVSYCEDIEDGLKGVLLGEYETGEILYSFNIDNPLEIASITKLMTYMVAMDSVNQGKMSLEDIVTVGNKPPKEWGNSFYLRTGEKIKLKTLVASMMIASCNDSCVAIAEFIAGSEEKFVELMNNKARDIGLKSANFINSNGLPEKNMQNTMSIKDIFKLARYVLKRYPEILNITKKEKIEVTNRNYKKENTNPLIGTFREVDGLKTGYTKKAGYCFISTMKVPVNKNNDKSFRLIGITMGAESEKIRKDKGIELLKYGTNNYKMKRIFFKGQSVGKIKVYDGNKNEINIYAGKDVYALVKDGNNIKKEVHLKNVYVPPLYTGQKVGNIIIYNNNEKIEVIDLIIKENIKESSVLFRLKRYLYRTY